MRSRGQLEIATFGSSSWMTYAPQKVKVLDYDDVIQRAMRTRRIILPSVVCLALPYFSTLSHKRYDCRKKLLNTKCAFFSLILS
jgi:hypothetical protein